MKGTGHWKQIAKHEDDLAVWKLLHQTLHLVRVSRRLVSHVHNTATPIALVQRGVDAVVVHVIRLFQGGREERRLYEVLEPNVLNDTLEALPTDDKSTILVQEVRDSRRTRPLAPTYE